MALLRRQIGYLLSGFVFWLPIGVVIVVVRYIFGNLEDLGEDILGIPVPERFIYSGLGIVLWIVVFFLTGLVLKKTAVGSFLGRIPVLGMFFKQSGETVTLDKLLSLSPCLFLYSPTCPSYGWILSEQKVNLTNKEAQFKLINVYYPNVPTIVTGQVYSVRKETVIRLGNPSRQIIDILLYGFRRPENIQYLPWEDESEQEFRQRAVRFGVVLNNERSPDTGADDIGRLS